MPFQIGFAGRGRDDLRALEKSPAFVKRLKTDRAALGKLQTNPALTESSGTMAPAKTWLRLLRLRRIREFKFEEIVTDVMRKPEVRNH